MFGNGAANNSFNKLPKYGNAQTTVKGSDSNSNTQKIKRKRDFSQVVDPTANPNMNTLGYNIGNSSSNSPSKNNNHTLQPLQSSDFPQNNHQNLYKQYLENNQIGETLQSNQLVPKQQFQTIQSLGGGQHPSQIDTDKSKSTLKQNQKKSQHLRSLTSQKGGESEQPSQMVTGQRNNGRRQPSASNISGKGGRQSASDHQEPNETIQKQNDTYGANQSNDDQEQN
jgi:hypothetical protein